MFVLSNKSASLGHKQGIPYGLRVKDKEVISVTSDVVR